MSYTIDDFTESLDQAQIEPENIKRVAASWGENGDYAEWEGGFLLEMNDGSARYVTGWCDTTGWGCQDGVEVKVYPALPNILDIDEARLWDIDPIDLNRYIEGSHATDK